MMRGGEFPRKAEPGAKPQRSDRVHVECQNKQNLRARSLSVFNVDPVAPRGSAPGSTFNDTNKQNLRARSLSVFNVDPVAPRGSAPGSTFNDTNKQNLRARSLSVFN